LSLSFGVAKIDSTDTVTHGCIAYSSVHGEDPTVTNEIIRDDSIATLLASDATTWSASISRNALGFNITPSANAGDSIVFYLALKSASDPDDFYVDVIDAKTSTGTQAYSSFGMAPTAFILGATTATAVNTIGQVSAFSYGAGDVDSERGWGCIDEDNQATTDVDHYCDTTHALHIRTAAGTASDIAQLSSLDSDGLTLNYTTASGSARKIMLWTMGVAGGAATPTVSIGSTEITNMYIGSTPITAVYIGSTQIWP